MWMLLLFIGATVEYCHCNGVGKTASSRTVKVFVNFDSKITRSVTVVSEF